MNFSGVACHDIPFRKANMKQIHKLSYGERLEKKKKDHSSSDISARL